METKSDTYANIIEPDEMGRIEPYHLDLHSLPFFYKFLTCHVVCKFDVSNFKVRRVHFRNYG